MSEEENTNKQQRIYDAFMNAKPYASRIPEHRLSRLAEIPDLAVGATALRHRILAEIYTNGYNFPDPGIFCNTDGETCFEWVRPGSGRFASIVCCKDGSAECYFLDTFTREEFSATLDQKLTLWFLHTYVLEGAQQPK